MVFVSYSHADKQMCDDFVEMMAPLEDYGPIESWVDTKIKPGEQFEKEIASALDLSTVAVLLVSTKFLKSKFIRKVELAYFLDATKKRGVKFMWVLISDCMWESTPLKHIQAAYSVAKPLDQLSPARQKTAWRLIAEKVDEASKDYERPVINKGIEGHFVFQEEPNLHVLSSPARRRTEIFVYSEGAKQWWHVGTVVPGKERCRCYFGDQHTADGRKFKILAVTTDTPVGGMMSPPNDRTQSGPIWVKRKSGSQTVKP